MQMEWNGLAITYVLPVQEWGASHLFSSHHVTYTLLSSLSLFLSLLINITNTLTTRHLQEQTGWTLLARDKDKRP